MDQVKRWWQSKGILVNLAGMLIAAAAALGIVPEGMDSSEVVAWVLAGTSALGAWFRKTATAMIGHAEDALARAREAIDRTSL
jgi:hypothetical protein